MAESVRTDRRTTDTRARVEAAALELFATKGYTATSLRDIAAALGITKAALYYHFPSKVGLARAIFQPFVDDVDAFLARADAASWSARRVLEEYFDAVAAHRTVFDAVIRDASVLAHVDLEGVTVRWLERLPELLVGPDPSPAERVSAIVATSGLIRVVLLPDVPIEQIRAFGVDAALRALDLDVPVEVG